MIGCLHAITGDPPPPTSETLKDARRRARHRSLSSSVSSVSRTPEEGPSPRALTVPADRLAPFVATSSNPTLTLRVSDIVSICFLAAAL